MSPYLFNIAIDLLPRWIKRLNELNFLLSPFPQCIACLLYADDTLIFLKPTANQAIRTKILFQIFDQVSGLKLNSSKSELAITSAPSFLGQNLADIIQCKAQAFPIKYLGLPLSDKRLFKSDYSSILDIIEKVLAGWKASLLPIGGRLILTNSVITALPQYYMSVFLLSKWLIKKIDQIRRRFLWHGHKQQQNQKRGLYMVNWALATHPRKLGGLGVRDIQISNQALLMKWMWLWSQQDQAWWKQITILPDPSDRPWRAPNASSFWKGLNQLAPAFDASTIYQIGNGNKIKFWHDNWAGSPLKLLFPNLYEASIGKDLSVDQYRHHGVWTLHMAQPSSLAQNERLQLLTHLQELQTTQSQDQIQWLRHQTFSAASAYNFLVSTPSPNSLTKKIWHVKAPLRVQIFAWLLLANRLTTTDNLIRRGWQLPNMCSMCKENEESAAHLFQTCTLAREIRKYIFEEFGTRYSIPNSYTEAASAQMLVDSTQTMCARQWEIVMCFVLWRERCRRIFTEKELQLLSIVREILFEWQA